MAGSVKHTFRAHEDGLHMCLFFVVCLLCDIQQLTHSRNFRHIAVCFIKHATENTMCELVCVCKRSLGNRNAHAVRLFFALCISAVLSCRILVHDLPAVMLPDFPSRFAGRNCAKSSPEALEKSEGPTILSLDLTRQADWDSHGAESHWPNLVEAYSI